jgi:hypothetical protein
VIIIILGIVPLAFKAPYEFTKLLAASVFAVGHPALCLFLDEQRDSGVFRRLARFTVWLLLILVPPLVAWNYLKTGYQPAVTYSQSVPLQAFMGRKPTTAPQVVALPSGISIPVRIRIYGNMFRNEEAIMPLTLSRPVEIALENGKPTGYFRIAGEKWKYYKYNIAIWGKDSLDCELNPAGGPTARAGLQINMEN